jgi:hypothetical protein
MLEVERWKNVAREEATLTEDAGKTKHQQSGNQFPHLTVLYFI